MNVIFNLLEPNSTGAPDYNICGQASSVLDLQDTGLIISVEDVVLFTTDDLLNDTPTIAASLPSAIGSTGLIFESFTINSITGAVILNISGIQVYDEKVLSIRASKNGYYTFENSFKLFGYDLGNETGVSTGNSDLSINLINKSNIVDIYGLQTRTFSKFTTYQKPFTNKTLVYNLVGTTGEITYTNVDSTAGIGGGQNAVVCSTTGLEIKQTIIVRDKDCNLYDTCESTQEVTQTVWFPPVNKSSYSALNCDSGCTSNLNTNSIELNLDYAAVNVFNINGLPNWLFSPNEPTETLYEQLVYELYDYNGQLIETETVDVTNFYDEYLADPSIITPTTFNFTMPVFGDVVVKIKYQIVKESDDVVIVECTKVQTYNSCNFWKIENDTTCGAFIVKNCSLLSGSLVISQLQDDKTFSTILEEDLDALSNLNIALESDGIYTFVFNYTQDGEEKTQTFTITNYCAFKTCYFEYLKKVQCGDVCENCNKTNFYDFVTFALNAQVFLALLNNEYAFNYVYTAIDTAKIEEIYTIKQFADRLNEYCSKSCGCSTC